MSADTADKILSSDWLVNLKLCSDWLGEPLTDELLKWRQTDKFTVVFYSSIKLCTHTHTQTHTQTDGTATSTLIKFEVVYLLSQVAKKFVTLFPFPEKGLITLSYC